MDEKSTDKSNRQLLKKVPNYRWLFRNEKNGIYYGIKKVGGKRRERSMETTDRKLAERQLKHWVERLEYIDPKAEKTTIGQLVETFEAGFEGKPKKTKATNSSLVATFKESWKPGLQCKVRDVRPSQINEWLASHEGRLRHTTYNRYAAFIRQLFDIAVADRIIAESPFDDVKTRWKRPQTPIRRRPTSEQLSDIIAEVRRQQFSEDREESADFLEFLAAASLGQAEASSLTWADVGPEWIKVQRRKTGAHFQIPMYKDVRPIIARLRARKPGYRPSDKVFAIKDARKALSSACKRLKLPSFSQRNLRQYGIVKLLRKRVDVKLIAEWQGHRDGGRLIMETYSEVIADDQKEYVAQMLERLDV